MPFRNPILGGTNLARTAINSPGYQHGVTGWTINRDGSAEFLSAVLRGKLTLIDPTDTTTVVATRHPGDAFDDWSVNIIGTQGWGGGSLTTDCYLARTAAGRMEFGNRLDQHMYGTLTDTAWSVFQDGDANPRALFRANGQLRFGDGTASTDTTIERAAAGVLTVNGNSILPNTQIVNALPAGTQNINTTAYTDITGVSLSFTKLYATSRVKVSITGHGFTSAVDNVTLGVNVNGADTDVDTYRYNAINDYRTFGGTVALAAFAAGVYTVKARLKVATGTTTWTTGASAARWSMEVTEIAP